MGCQVNGKSETALMRYFTIIFSFEMICGQLSDVKTTYAREFGDKIKNQAIITFVIVDKRSKTFNDCNLSKWLIF